MAYKLSKIPTHVAIIMDGNGRWATKRGLPRKLGHREGVKAIERTIKSCKKLGIKYCTFFAFSTENWKRSQEEIDGIFSLLRDYLKKDDNIFIKEKIKVESIGVLDPFPEDLKQSLEDIKRQTKQFEDVVVCFALNYGGRDDIIRAVNKLIKIGYKEITEENLINTLDTHKFPAPDLIIRTSGEKRISNFLLFQMAYSEFYFLKVYWPDFNEKHLLKALKNYEKRDRRFGGAR